MEGSVNGERIHECDGGWEGVSKHDALFTVFVQLLYEAKPVDDQPGTEPGGGTEGWRSEVRVHESGDRMWKEGRKGCVDEKHLTCSNNSKTDL